MANSVADVTALACGTVLLTTWRRSATFLECLLPDIIIQPL